MRARDQAIAYVRSLIASDSSPEHVRNVCRLALVKWPGIGLSVDQLKAEVGPSTLYGFGKVEVVSC